jgi:hypothetical protein
MRKFMALMALLCSTASAHAADHYCSDKSDLIYADNGRTVILRTGRQVERYKRYGSVGTGLNGTVFKDSRGRQDASYSTSIQIDSNPWLPRYVIFRNDVFWRCE